MDAREYGVVWLLRSVGDKVGILQLLFEMELKRLDLPVKEQLDGPLFVGDPDDPASQQWRFDFDLVNPHGALILFFGTRGHNFVNERGIVDLLGEVFPIWNPVHGGIAKLVPFGDIPDISVLGPAPKEESQYWEWVRRAVQLEGPKMMARVEYGTALRGIVILDDIPDAVVSAIRELDTASVERWKLSQDVITHIIFPYASHLVDVLRIHYGQYWLAHPYPPKFDSEQDNPIGDEFALRRLRFWVRQYCQHVLHLKFRVSQDEEWCDYFADDQNPWGDTDFYGSPDYVDQGIVRYREYVSPSDLADIERRVAEDIARGNEITMAGKVLAHAYELVQQQQFNYALIEAVMALELAIGEFVQSHPPKTTPSMSKKTRFERLGKRLELTAPEAGIVNTRVVKQVLNTITLRNKVVHEGRELTRDQAYTLRNEIMTLLDVAAHYLQQPFRFVSPPDYPFM